jgi:Tfp pilus assembly protein PilZ
MQYVLLYTLLPQYLYSLYLFHTRNGGLKVPAVVAVLRGKTIKMLLLLNNRGCLFCFACCPATMLLCIQYDESVKHR